VKKTGSWLPLYLVVGFIWGCSFIFIKAGLEFLTPFGVQFIRCALGAITLYSFARYRKIQLPRGAKTLFHIWVVSLLLNVFPGIFFALAETEVTSILAGIINAVTPLMTLIAILAVNREEHTSELQSHHDLVCRLLLEKKNNNDAQLTIH